MTSSLFTGIYEYVVAVDDVNDAAAAYGAAMQGAIDPETTHLENGIGIKMTGVWVGEHRIAFVQDATGTGPVARWRQKHGEGLYQICVRTSNLEAAIAHMKANGFRIVNEAPTVLVNHTWKDEIYSEVRVVFVHPASAHGVQMEIQEWTK